jgi:hypothetical protein
MSVKNEPTQQETAEHVFGVNIDDAYPWWSHFEGSWDFRQPAPNGWHMTVRVDDPEGSDTITAMVTHSMILGALRKIARGAGPNTRFEAVEECAAYLIDRAPISTETADQVVQVAVLGSVRHS